ncbi:hypothetical protein Misp01_24450 [Microtetraspora sp. NBRC 13810]|nr:hypothetical protein Misp01_24450 [Microtetraspora sp. NBRC 13810]
MLVLAAAAGAASSPVMVVAATANPAPSAVSRRIDPLDIIEGVLRSSKRKGALGDGCRPDTSCAGPHGKVSIKPLYLTMNG